MAATEFVSEVSTAEPLTREAPVTSEELRDFFLTGRGLDRLRVSESLGVAETAEFPTSALPAIYGGILTAGRAGARARFLRELKQCVTALQDLLTVDDSKLGSASAERVTASLGADAARYLSVSRLMALWARRTADKPVSMASERRRRCETALAVLNDAVRRHEESPAFLLFCSGEDAAPDLAAACGRVQRSLDPCADALAFCNRQWNEIAPVLRALRVAKLEAASAYDPGIHDDALSRFDAQAAEPWEIAALPAVVALQPAEQLSLNSLSQVLLSDRPVQVLISDSGGPDAPDFGAVALMYRAAFVLQTSLARQEHFSKGFSEMAQAMSPAVAVVAVPPADRLALTRAFPLFRYDPDRPGEWADRFELCPADSPGFEALVLASRSREDLRALPAEFRHEGLMELGQYLKMQQAGPAFTIPFVSVTDEAGHPLRIVVTSAMVRLCRDRIRAWEMLAALAARPKPAAHEIMPAVEPSRDAAAKEAYMRVIAMLANPEELVRGR
jgi:hypothetical protein